MDRRSPSLSVVLFCAVLIPHWCKTYNTENEMYKFCARFCPIYCKTSSDLECELCKDCKCQSRVCQMPKVETSHCLRFYFDPKLGSCTSTIYGYRMVTANQNNFKTLEDCIRACPNPIQNLDCRLPKEAGPCHDFVTRYFYNKDSRKCEFFIYGGCDGNANNYESLTECEEACSMYMYGEFGRK